MKRIAYHVEGTLDSHPGDGLPEGLVVSEVEVEDPKFLRVENKWTASLTIRPGLIHPEMIDVLIERPADEDSRTAGIAIDRSHARQVRDCLAAILGESESTPIRRVFRDREHDLWWEVEPDSFTHQDSFEAAVSKLRGHRLHGDRTHVDQTLEYITTNYGPLVDVTHEHPEVTP